MANTENKHQKVYVEIIKRTDGIERVRARWWNIITGKPQNRIMGLRSDFPGSLNKNQKLQMMLDELRLQVNSKPKQLLSYSVAQCCHDYRTEALVVRQEGEDMGYSSSYVVRTLPVVEKYILPAWGHYELKEMGQKGWEIQKWIDSLKRKDEDGKPGKPLARGTKAKVKYTMQSMFKYAILRNRFEGVNPLKTFSQSAKRAFTPQLLTVEQFEKLIAKLAFRERLLVFLAMTTGLRRSEITGLQWKDVDFLGLQINVSRGVVDGVVGECKSEASEAPVPLSAEVAEMLKAWRQLTNHNPDDFVFVAECNRAGKEQKGRRPLCLTRVFQYWVKPVAKELSINIRNFGWHTFRRTYITWVAAVTDNPKVTMELARHANISTTMNVYADLKKQKGLKEAHAKGLTRLDATLKHFSNPVLCIATHGFSGKASDGTISDVADFSVPSTRVPVV